MKIQNTDTPRTKSLGSAKIVFRDSLIKLLKINDQTYIYYFRNKQKITIKHVVESLGIPHTEVDRIYVHSDGTRYVSFDYHIKTGDLIEIFPFDARIKSKKYLLQKRWDIEPRFILDNHLGTLTKYLRMLGLDALYDPAYSDAELAKIAHEENRNLLSRDRRLLMRNLVQNGYLIKSLYPDEQIKEVIERFNLLEFIQPFQKCLVCNTQLVKVPKEKIITRLQPLTKKYYHEFKICPNCYRIYWKGSHYERMLSMIEKLTNYSYSHK